jgi:hypothetical protein
MSMLLLHGGDLDLFQWAVMFGVWIGIGIRRINFEAHSSMLL